MPKIARHLESLQKSQKYIDKDIKNIIKEERYNEFRTQANLYAQSVNHIPPNVLNNENKK